MTQYLNDQFTRSTNIISGASASPTGGAWTTVVSSHDSGTDIPLSGSAYVIGGSSGDVIASYKNAAVAGAIAGSATIEFTPSTDGWIAGVIVHADSDSYPCWLAWASGDNAYISRYDSAADSLAMNRSGPWSQPVAASNRSAHTLTANVAADGTITISIDGTPVSGASVDDALLTTAGRAGFVARGVSIAYVTADDAPAAPAPTITTGPTPVNVTEPAAATFTGAFSGTATSVQWKRKAGGSGSAVNVVGGTGATTLGGGTVSYTTGATSVTGGDHNHTDTYGFVLEPGAVESTYAALTVNAASSLTGTAALDGLSASGSMEPQPPSDLTGSATLDGLAAAGSMAMAPGTLTVPELRSWAGMLLVSQLVENIVVIRMSDRTLLCAFTNQTTHGTTGNLALSHAALAAGTLCMVVGYNPDGSARFARPVTVV